MMILRHLAGRLSACALLLLLLLPVACALTPPPHIPDPQLTPLSFQDLRGWQEDRVEEIRPALQASCARLATLPDNKSLGAQGRMGTVSDWHAFCANLNKQPDLRRYLEATLRPWALTDGGDPNGLFTGYYESELHGSLTRQGPYQTPLYRRPPDLVDGVPYHDRASIVSGALNGRGLELLWLDDPVDAFFVQVQGSGRVQLPDGRVVRIGYDGKNGQPYVSIGRKLVERGDMKLEDVSLQSLRAWLNTHPDRLQSTLNLNPSYVFFRFMDRDAPPTGAANVPLTPQRSLAVDNAYVGYHVPVWLETDTPALHRLMVAQDTGGAIRGVVRGDVFWGHGPAAEQQAGTMRSAGRYVVLLPRTFTP